MADSDLANLTLLDPPESADLLYVVHDPSGTPLDRKTTVGILAEAIWSLLGGALPEDFVAFNPLLPNPTLATQTFLNLGATITTVYTVPSGKKAIVTGFTVNNQNAGNNVAYINLHRGSSDVRVSTQVTYATLQGATHPSTNCPFVFEAADVIQVSASATDLNLKINILTFDDSSPLKSTLVTSFSVGDNTLYTVPALKRFRNSSGNFALQPLSALTVFYTNNSGNTRTPKVYHVSSGGSIIARNQLPISATIPTNLTSTVADGGAIGVSYGVDLEAGDAIALNLDANTPSQAAYVTGYEYTP